MKAETPRDTARYAPYPRPTPPQASSQPQPALEPAQPILAPASSQTTEANNPIVHPPTTYTLDFGKHRGKKLEDVDESYIAWLEKEGVPDKRPNLKAALYDHYKAKAFRPKPQPVPSHAQSVLSERSPNVGTPASSTATPKIQSQSTQPGDYVLDFGKHKGLRLQDVPNKAYMHWLAGQVASGGCQSFIGLPTALTSLGYLTKDNKQVLIPLKPKYKTPQSKGIKNVFKDYNRRALWITVGDARAFFGLEDEYLKPLPRVETRDKKPRYWLYHVWHVLKTHSTEQLANDCLDVFRVKQSKMIDLATSIR